ncbi:unnamed protein product, partial [Polarella glacialis]
AALTANPINTLAGSRGKAKRQARTLLYCKTWTQALDKLCELRLSSSAPGSGPYSSAIRLCEQSGKWRQALGLLATLVLEGQDASAEMYGDALAACGKAQQWRRVLQLLADMEEVQLQPNARGLSAALQACQKSDQLFFAATLLRRLKLLGNPGDSSASLKRAAAALGLEEAELGRCLLFHLPRSGQELWEQGVALLRDAREKRFHLGPVVSEASIVACSDKGQWAMAWALLEDMRTEQLDPSNAAFALATQTPFAGTQKVRWEAALGLLREMQGRHLEPTAALYSTVMVSCQKAGQWKLCLEVLSQTCSAVALGIEAYVSAVIAFGQGQCWEHSLSILREIQVKHSSTLQLKPMLNMYNAVLSSCAHCGAWEQGLALLSEMQSHGPKPDAVAYYMVIRLCQKCDQWALAEQLTSAMSKVGLPSGYKAKAAHDRYKVASRLVSNEIEQTAIWFAESVELCFFNPWLDNSTLDLRLDM